MEITTTQLLVTTGIGVIIGFLLTKIYYLVASNAKKDHVNQLDRDYIELKTKATLQLEAAQKNISEKEIELGTLKTEIRTRLAELKGVNEELFTTKTSRLSIKQAYDAKLQEYSELKSELLRTRELLDQTRQKLATADAHNHALNEKLESQKQEMGKLSEKLNLEFQNIATGILDANASKFAEQNKASLAQILEPLGQNIDAFKSKVHEVYLDETKERSYLKNEIKNLVELNKIMSDETRNLTKALKGESKTQGRWGEMILESILERSGLVKNREYFMEHELLDADGNAIRSQSEGKKMRPDAVIKYPDNRHVIIDSKVSLNAFTRLLATELNAHISAIKNHIISLSTKGYDDYDKSLDFVMLFIPSEPAYMAALQGDPDLWNFAYDKKILLLSPTNLITSLKLIVDLWKREYQNQNAIEIAERGAKLYDKFYGFVESLQSVGDNLERAKSKYDKAFGQLTSGNDNLVLQTTKLRDLGLKTKKNISDLGLPNTLNSTELP
jgi:DNA recombination protein RmuC